MVYPLKILWFINTYQHKIPIHLLYRQWDFSRLQIDHRVYLVMMTKEWVTLALYMGYLNGFIFVLGGFFNEKWFHFCFGWFFQ
jgi:hypothetical protein